MTKNLYYTEELGLRALLIDMGAQIDAIKSEIADLKNNPQPPSIHNSGQLGLFGASQGTAAPDWQRIQFLETQLYRYHAEYHKANKSEVDRRLNSEKYIEVVVADEKLDDLQLQIYELVNNLGGPEKESLGAQIVQKFEALRWKD